MNEKKKLPYDESAPNISQTPTKNGLATPYGFDPNAPIRTPREGNFSTADHALRRIRAQAHREALASEDKHYQDTHRQGVTITSKPAEPEPITTEPHSNRLQIRATMERLIRRR